MTASDFNGWTYYANEKENLNKVMEWIQNNQATSSLPDLLEYPKEFVNHALTGFFTTHAITIAAIVAYGSFSESDRNRQLQEQG